MRGWAVLLLLLLGCGDDASTELYVDALADDAGDGSREHPFQSALRLHGGRAELRNSSVSGVGPALQLQGGNADFQSVIVSVSEASSEGDYGGDALLVQDATLRWVGGGSSGALDRALVSENSALTLDSLALDSQTRAALSRML